MLSLSNVRVNNAKSEETINFIANVVINGRVVGDVWNEGRGGAHRYEPQELVEAVGAYDVENEDVTAGADELIDELVTRHDTVAHVEKQLKKGFVVLATSNGACSYVKAAEAAANAEEDNSVTVFNTAIEGAAAILAVELNDDQPLLSIELPAGVEAPAELPEVEIKPAKKSSTPAVKADKPAVNAAPKAESKMDVCRRIFAENIGKKRSEVIALFMEAGCTKAGSSTYYQTCKKASETAAPVQEAESAE